MTRPALAALALALPNVGWAFCNEISVVDIPLHCSGQGHGSITEGYLDTFLRDPVVEHVQEKVFDEDLGDAADAHERHVDNCWFEESGEYIRWRYDLAVAALDPADPSPYAAATHFGLLLHGVQDLYAHSNWVELLEQDFGPWGGVDPANLLETSTGPWRDFTPLTTVTGDIVVGEVPTDGLPAGWTAELGATSAIPVITTSEGAVYRALTTHWNPPPDGRCLDVRDGTVVDQYSDVDVYGQSPRTTRLVHGDNGWFRDDDERPCDAGYPTWVCLNKDNEGRPGYGEAFSLAGWQTQQEWCRMLHLAADSPHGLDAASILMTLWADPDEPPPHPAATSCYPDAPGPLEVKVSVDALRARHRGASSGEDARYVLSLYTADFHQSAAVEAERQVASAAEDVAPPDPVTLCVQPSDAPVAALWGYDEGPVIQWRDSGSDYDGVDAVLRGATLPISTPGVFTVSAPDLDVTFRVEHDPTDADADGLSVCAEAVAGTSEADADADDDGLLDGEEVALGTSPLDSDSDDDGLLDGEELSLGLDPLDSDTDDDALLDGEELALGTDPLDPDSDDDAVDDGSEVQVYGTDPLDPDSDDDGMPDGAELDRGTDPLDPDSDGDGVVDGQDPSWLADAVAALPDDALAAPGHRDALLAQLASAEARVASGRTTNAVTELDLVRAKLDGCGAAPDRTDWVVDCPTQLDLRAGLDLLLANL